MGRLATSTKHRDSGTRAEGGEARAVAVRRSATAPPLKLDRLIHERIRLGIISALAVHEVLTFNELREMLKTTDGNLSVHARKLEEARYIACRKFFEGRVPKTEFRLSEAGRRALDGYLRHMEALIRATRAR